MLILIIILYLFLSNFIAVFATRQIVRARYKKVIETGQGILYTDLSSFGLFFMIFIGWPLYLIFVCLVMIKPLFSHVLNPVEKDRQKERQKAIILKNETDTLVEKIKLIQDEHPELAESLLSIAESKGKMVREINQKSKRILDAELAHYRNKYYSPS